MSERPSDSSSFKFGRGVQPPDPEDLRRFPPKTDLCRTVRGLLRDFADGERLAPVERPTGSQPGGGSTAVPGRRLVEEHVHDCRDCSLALSRAEHEVWILRQALQRRPEALRPDSGFASRVAARAMGELAAELAVHDVDDRAVDAARGRRAAPMWRRAALPVAAVLTLGLALVIVLGRGEADSLRDGPAPPPVVMSAMAAVWSDGADVRVDDAFAPGESMWVADGGEVRLNLWAPWRAGRNGERGRVDPGDGSRSGTAAERRSGERRTGVLRLGGETAVQRGAEGDWSLHRGVLDAELEQELKVTVLDGSRVTLTPGRYLLVSDEVVRHDQALDPLGALRLRIEVERGLARVLPAGADEEDEIVAIVGGQAGVFLTGEAWRTESLVGDAALTAALRPEPKGEADDPLWFSRVVDGMTGQPLPGATVSLWTASGPQVIRTDLEGRFRVTDMDEWQDRFGPTAVIAVRPAAQAGVVDPDFQPGMVLPAPRALAEVTRRGDRFLADPIVVQPSRAVRGWVRTPDHRGVEAAAVWPAVRDELFGTLEFLDGFHAFTDAEGGFVLRGLPARLEPMQSLVALVGRPGLGVSVLVLDADGSKGLPPPIEVTLRAAVGATFAVPAGVDRALHWQIAEAFPDLGGAAAVLRVAESDEFGRVRFTVASGAMASTSAGASGSTGPQATIWVRHAVENGGGGWSDWHRLSPPTSQAPGTDWVVSPRPDAADALPPSLGRNARGRSSLASSGAPAAIGLAGVEGQVGSLGLQWVPGLRYERVRTTDTGTLQVTALDTASHRVRDADIFVQGPSGAVWYAGSFDGSTARSVDLELGGVLWGIDRSGAAGRLPIAAGTTGVNVVIPVTAMSKLQLGVSRRGTAASAELRLECTSSGGMLGAAAARAPLLRRVEVGGLWQTSWLPSGTWTVLLPGGEVEVVDLAPGVIQTVR